MSQENVDVIRTSTTAGTRAISVRRSSCWPRTLSAEVLVLERETYVGRASGVRAEARTGGIYTVTDGRIVRVRGFMSQGEALEAAGLAQ
jgi:hypothetical protein